MGVGFFKGALLGLGAVALAPVLGPIGAISGLGAAVGIGIGGVMGLANEEEEEGKRRKATKLANQQNKIKLQAKRAAQINKLLADKVERKVKSLRTHQDRLEMMFGLYKLMIIFANADGEIQKDEQNVLTGYRCSMTQVLPKDMRRQLNEFETGTPSLNDVIPHLLSLDDQVDWGLLDDCINNIINIDGIRHEKEELLYRNWKQLVGDV